MNGGELEQIQFLLGHVSVLTTERYLGCKQNLEEPVNDRFGCLFSRTSVDDVQDFSHIKLPLALGGWYKQEEQDL
jgi:hypothetical protein